MNGLRFEEHAPVIASAPNRTDVACFVGFVSRRETSIPQAVWDWLRSQGWTSPPYARPSIDQLLDVPVPIDTWELFDRLFVWDGRPLDGRGQVGTTYLGAAIRSFFSQGGRKCYVVRAGDPWPLTSARADRIKKLESLVPGYPNSFTPSAVDRNSWRGVCHIFGLPEVSFLCLPDLADVVSMDRAGVATAGNFPPIEEQFVECSEGETALAEDRRARLFAAPRCDEEGYKEWASVLARVSNIVARQQREIQIVAAIPMPTSGITAERDLLEFLLREGNKPLASPIDAAVDGLASAFVQMAYPWVRTSGSTNLPEQLESPDAVLVGLLARNALTRGTFRSAAKLHLSDVSDVYPSLSHDQMRKPHPDDSSGSGVTHNLLERVSIFGSTPSGLRLLSDVTTSLDESYRPACLNRLVSVIARTARRLGEDMIFESSGERLWAQLRASLNSLLLGLMQAGALHGASREEAFQVRCDRSTMSQNDIDNGRAIVYVKFNAAAPIAGITVVMAMGEGGRVSLTTVSAEGVAA